MLRLNQLTKTYKNKIIFQDTSFEANSGEICLIFGPSGSGKSTLLEIISGLKYFQKGHYRYNQQDLSKAIDGEMSQFRKENIGYIPQNFELIEDYTVLDNLLLTAHYLKIINREQLIAQIEQLATRLGFSNLLHQKVRNISGGQKQRVAICRAFIGNKPIILADEPTANLDKRNLQKIIELFSEQKKNEKILIIATHDERWCQIADRIYHIQNGKLEEEQRQSKEFLG